MPRVRRDVLCVLLSVALATMSAGAQESGNASGRELAISSACCGCGTLVGFSYMVLVQLLVMGAQDPASTTSGFVAWCAPPVALVVVSTGTGTYLSGRTLHQGGTLVGAMLGSLAGAAVGGAIAFGGYYLAEKRSYKAAYALCPVGLVCMPVGSVLGYNLSRRRAPDKVKQSLEYRLLLPAAGLAWERTSESSTALKISLRVVGARF